MITSRKVNFVVWASLYVINLRFMCVHSLDKILDPINAKLVKNFEF
jgi:hypothetical protein